MEKTIIPTWAEVNAKRYHTRSKLEHFIYEYDPCINSDKFKEMLSDAIEQEKRKAINFNKKRRLS